MLYAVNIEILKEQTKFMRNVRDDRLRHAPVPVLTGGLGIRGTGTGACLDRLSIHLDKESRENKLIP